MISNALPARKKLLAASITSLALSTHAASGFRDAPGIVGSQFDMAGKDYLVAVVEGAATGMGQGADSGSPLWSRIEAQVAIQGTEQREIYAPVRAQAREDAQEGFWSEDALEGYLDAIEMPRARYQEMAHVDLNSARPTMENWITASLYLSGDGGVSARNWYRQQAMSRAIILEIRAISEIRSGNGVSGASPMVNLALQIAPPEAASAQVTKSFIVSRPTEVTKQPDKSIAQIITTLVQEDPVDDPQSP